jgi:prevent-host-death family protein
MVKILSMVKLRTALSDVVERLLHDEPVVVTHYNRAVAVILPLAEYERITGQVFHYARPDDGEACFMQDGQRVV